MATSDDIKKRALELSEKTDSNSISPKEVGGIMHDLASLGENALRNGGTLGIRKVYASIAEMEADKNPKDLWGNPLKKGNLVVIYNGTTTGTDNNKVYAYMNPGWQFATYLDAGYATRSELSKLASTDLILLQQLGQERKLESTTVIGYYLDNKGAFVELDNSFMYKYSYVQAGTIIKGISYESVHYGGVGLFTSLPNANSIADRLIRSNMLFIVPYDCYVVVSGDINGIDRINIYALDIDQEYTITKKVNDIKNASRVWTNEDGYLNGFINEEGENKTVSPHWGILYAKVAPGDTIKFTGKTSGNYRAGYTISEPISGFTLSTIIPTDTPSPYIATQEGYFCISNDIVDSLSLDVYRQVNTEDSLLVNSVIPMTPISTIKEYYIDEEGAWVELILQCVNIYKVEPKNIYKIEANINNHYALCSWFSELPEIGDTPLLCVPFTDNSKTEQKAPKNAKYLAVSAYVGDEPDKNLKVFNKVKIDDVVKELQEQQNKKEETNIRCLFIGDSISTRDNYQWKGFLEENYKLSYVRDMSGQLAPANGGITIMPPLNESEDIQQKSIWYRCSGNRMSIYDFDIISLFGGTNDMTNENLVIGNVNDVAYVDNANDFTADDNVTDVRPDNLSLASALRGCILMLKRDFPSKEIVLPTVMPCGHQYGNWTDTSTGLRASEAIAEMQMKMAEKYKLKAIPLYWSMNYPNMDNNMIWVKDGVHPNMQGALNIQRMFAQILCL